VSALELAQGNLLSPVVLAFAFGILAARLKSDLAVPEGLMDAASLYLLLAIGLKGGVELAEASLADLWLPALVTLSLGLLIPVGVFAAGRGSLRLGVDDASSLAAHYGSVSVVTFTAAVTLLEARDVDVEGFMTTLLAMLEVPGIVVALALARSSAQGGFGPAVRETLTGKSVMLLMGGLAIGALAGAERFERAVPVFVDAFYGVLVLFLLGLGITVGHRLGDVRVTGWRLVTFALVAPLVQGTVGTILGAAAGLSAGSAAVLGVMAASASYIAAPAAVRVALPRASPALSLVPALCITFPFNLVVGIPLFYALAHWIT
jgi:hypothetical protein